MTAPDVLRSARRMAAVAQSHSFRLGPIRPCARHSTRPVEIWCVRPLPRTRVWPLPASSPLAIALYTSALATNKQVSALDYDKLVFAITRYPGKIAGSGRD